MPKNVAKAGVESISDEFEEMARESDGEEATSDEEIVTQHVAESAKAKKR